LHEICRSNINTNIKFPEKSLTVIVRAFIDDVSQNTQVSGLSKMQSNLFPSTYYKNIP